jgi:hypothetical protein
MDIFDSVLSKLSAIKEDISKLAPPEVPCPQCGVPMEQDPLDPETYDCRHWGCHNAVLIPTRMRGAA